MTGPSIAKMSSAWTDAANAELIALARAGRTAWQIADTLGRSEGAIKKQISVLRQRGLITWALRAQAYWTPQEVATLMRMHRAGEQNVRIARALGRPPSSVAAKLDRELGRARVTASAVSIVADARQRAALAERDRKATLAPRSLTAAFFGDPLPGCSALDRRG